MATAAMEQDQQQSDLENSIAALDERIGRQRLEVHEWEEKARSASEFLSELRAQHAETCADAVLGKASQGAVNKIAGQIVDVENKVIGIEKIVAVKRNELSESQAALQPLQIEQTRLAQARMIAEERDATEQLIAATDRALADLNTAATKFADGINSLRQRRYIGEANKHTAFDAAQSLERRGAGMRA
jgi:hypothetical protein